MSDRAAPCGARPWARAAGRRLAGRAMAGALTWACACAEPTVVINVDARATLDAPSFLEFRLRDDARATASGVLERDVRDQRFPLEFEVLAGDLAGIQTLEIAATVTDSADGTRVVGNGAVAFDADSDVEASVIIEPAAFAAATSVLGNQQLASPGVVTGRPAAVAADGSILTTWRQSRQDELQIQARLWSPTLRPRVNATNASFDEFPMANSTALARNPSVAAGDAGYLTAFETGQSPISIQLQLHRADDGALVGQALGLAPEAEGLEAIRPVPFASGAAYGVAWLAKRRPGQSAANQVQVFVTDPTFSATRNLAASPSETDQANPDAVALDDGTFVVAWQQQIGDTARFEALFRRFDADGNAIGEARPVPGRGDIDSTESPKLAALPGGGFALSWVYRSGQDGRRSLRLQRFDGSARPVDEAGTLVAPVTERDTHAAMAAAPDGTLAVVWHTTIDTASGLDVYATFYRDGLPLSEPFAVHSDIAGDQSTPAVVALADGGFLTLWTDTSGRFDSSDEGVAGRAIYPPLL